MASDSVRMSRIKENGDVSASDVAAGMDDVSSARISDDCLKHVSFEEPQLEFDEVSLSLDAMRNSPFLDEILSPEDDDLDNMFSASDLDDDFEVQLGSAAEVHDDEMAESEFHDVSKYRVVELAVGDDPCGRKTVVFSSCRLPPRSGMDHAKLLQYLKHTLDQYVENDYTLIYFHYGLTKENRPSYRWLLQAYREFERKYKKNLKALYIVHPTTFIKVLWKVFRPLISAKFGKKITYVNYLHELGTYVPLSQLSIPDPVLDHDVYLLTKYRPPIYPTAVIQAPTAAHQFKVSLEFMRTHSPTNDVIPRVVRHSVTYLERSGMAVEGIFRRSANPVLIKIVQDAFNDGGSVDFDNYGGPHIASVILKTFLRELPEPLLTFELYDYVMRIHTLEGAERMRETRRVLAELPASNHVVLQYIIRFLVKVAARSSENLMTHHDLAVVFGPNLVWPRNQVSLAAIQQINAFTEMLLRHAGELFRGDN